MAAEWLALWGDAERAGFAWSPVDAGVVPPSATASADDLSPAVGQSVTFSVVVTGATPTTYLWDFGDGDTSTSAAPSHTFDDEDTFSVSVLVNGTIESNTLTVTATRELPTEVPTAPDQTFTELSAPTDCLDSAFIAGIDTLVAKRLGQCPVAKATTYRVSATGSYLTGDGTAEFPGNIQSANELLRADSTLDWTGQTGTVPGAPFRFNGQSFTVGGMVRLSTLAGAYFGTVLGMSDGKWLLSPSNAATGQPFVRFSVSGGDVDLTHDDSIGEDTPALVSLSYNHTTRLVKLQINGGTAKTTTLASQPDVSAGDLVHNGGWFGAWNGTSGRLFVAEDEVLSDAELVTLYNAGKGLRWVQVPNALKSKMTAWWDLYRTPGASAFVDFPDSLGGSDMVKSATGNADSLTPLDEDDAVTASGTDAVGGADMKITLLTGTYTLDPADYPDGAIVCTRSNVTLDVSGCTLSYFDKQFPVGSSWSLDEGTTYYAAAATDCRAWIKKVGDDTAGEVEAGLYLAETIAEVRATADSFTWDAANGGRVYINVGGHPDTVSPSGWEAIPWDFAAGDESVPPMIQMGTNATTCLRLVGGGTCNILGGGNSIPGSTGAAAVYVNTTDDGEWAMTGVRIDCCGYHGFVGVGGLGSRGLTALNVVGCGTWRNEGATLNGGNGDPLVQFVGTPGGNEGLSWYDRCTGGYRPDWETDDRVGAALGYRFHDGPLSYRAVIGFDITADSEGGHVFEGPSAGSTETRASVSAVRDWVIDTTCSIANVQICNVAINGAHVNCIEAAGTASGYARSIGGKGTGTGWLVNCGVSYTISGANPVQLYGNAGGETLDEVWIGGQISVNCGTDDFELSTGNDVTTLNTILSVTTTGTKGVGAGTLTPTYTAFFGYTASGTGAVTLGSAPAYPPVAASGLLVGAGTATGASEYDADNEVRPVPPDIGTLNV